MKDSPGSKVYIIVYLNADFEMVKNDRIITRKKPALDQKSYARKMIQAAHSVLLKNGFTASQIVFIDGGYLNGNGRRLEFWFVPQGGVIPKPKPDYIPKKAK